MNLYRISLYLPQNIFMISIIPLSYFIGLSRVHDVKMNIFELILIFKIFIQTYLILK